MFCGVHLCYFKWRVFNFHCCAKCSRRALFHQNIMWNFAFNFLYEPGDKYLVFVGADPATTSGCTGGGQHYKQGTIDRC